MPHHQYFGLLNINKPPGITSRKVVDHIAKLVEPAKAGHAGTLDPMATGVLVICVGAATRLTSFVQQQPKEYRATFQLGKRSNTDDITGEVVDVSNASPVSQNQIETLLPQFIGKIEQVPPQFSAVHINGRRAYELARKGKPVEMKPRTVEVYRITLNEFRYPEMELDIECGSGTYIRSIGRDLGNLLGCGAVMSNLVRTRIGPFRLVDAADLDQLTTTSLPDVLLPATKAVEHLPQYICQLEDLDEIRHGRLVSCVGGTGFDDGALIAVFTPEKELACLACYREEDRTLAPKQVFLKAAC